MRDTLQSVYGGNGVGFMPITHEAPGFRRSVVHAFSGWKTSSMSAAKGNYNLGINGHAYRPDSASYVYFAGSNRYKHTRNFDSFNLYYTSSQPVAARLLVNDTIRRQVEMKNSSLPAKISFGISNIRKVRLNVPSVAGVVLFGASLEDSTGIYIDNFSVKGNSGLGLLAIPDRNLARFDSLLNYDLIVLQFGLNAVDAKTRDYSAYMQGMKKLVGKFRRTFPGTPILLMSVSDRSERVQGKYVTMKSIKGLVAEQQRFAANNQLLFWNLFEAMGGDNSMAKLVTSKPPLANKDYTHLNFQGSRVLGVRFARSFIYEGKQYLKRSENQVSSNHTQAVGNAVL
jgi:lysophospholipase L1-like esterase